MTLKSFASLGNFMKTPHYSPIDRYHSGSGGYHHSGSGGYHHSGSGGYHHGSRGGHKSKGGSGAALSALTLLAFLFLINVMQQSLQDNNSTSTMMTTNTVVLREGEQPIVLDAKEETDSKKGDGSRQESAHGFSSKSKIHKLNNQYNK